MTFYLVGTKKELLLSFVPDTNLIDAIEFLSKVPKEAIDSTDKALVVVDIDNISVKPWEVYNMLSQLNFSTIWAHYSQNEGSIKKRLKEIGFDQVFSYEDNIGEAIQSFAENT